MTEEHPPPPENADQKGETAPAVPAPDPVAAEKAVSVPDAISEARPADSGNALSGERFPAPRGPVLTALLAVTGILLVLRAGRLLGKVILRYRQPAEVRVTADGISVLVRTEMLGKVLRDRVIVIPKAGLLRAVREVRYPRLGMYAGLIALALGSYVGVGLMVDGLRAASASMIGMGALFALLGLGIDFAIASLLPGSAGHCRVILVPRRGAVLCVGSVDPDLADRLLAQLNAA